MGIRLVTTIVGIIAIIAILYFLPPWVLAAAVCLLSGVAAYELLGATGKLKGHPLMWVACAAAAAVPYCTAYAPREGSVTLVLFTFGFIAFVMGIFDYTRVTFEKLAIAFMGAFILPYFLSSLLRIYVGAGELGKYYILMPCIAAWVSDIMAYLVGRMMGKHKLAPHVSPKKTVEGAVCGMLSAIPTGIIISLLSNYLTPIPMWLCIVTAFLCAAMGQIGDLAESLIKRMIGVKDFSNLIPGHGGMFDRVDSLLFSIPTAYFCLYFASLFA